jgi:hypothetical protein
VLSLAAGMLLLEVLAFRLCAATLGHGFAAFVGILLPAAAAFGAATLGRRSPTRSVARMARSAAHLAAFGGGCMVAGAIALTWASQSLATAADEGSSIQVIVVLTGWLLPAMLLGASLALCLRIGVPIVGRLGFAEALGAAVASLLLPFVLSIGAPRAALGSGFILTLAAFALGYVGRSKKPRWATIATLPLAVASLLAGDFGAPWMKVRMDEGRRSKIEITHWTPQGALGVQKIERGKARFQYDRSPVMRLAAKPKGATKPRFFGEDLLYFLNEKAEGPVLVVGSRGGRALAVALAYGHKRVDGIALEGAFLNRVLSDEKYASITGNLLADERLRFHIGDGRKLPDALAAGYQRIVLHGYALPQQIGPRLLMAHDRLFTRESIRRLLERLQPQGALLIRVPRPKLSSVMSTAAEAVGGEARHARQHLFSCASNATAIVVAHRERLDPRQVQNLTKRCKKSRLTVEYPLSEPRRGHRQTDDLKKQRDAALAELWAGGVATDNLPFSTTAPKLAELRAETLGALRALQPRRAAAKSVDRVKTDGADKTKEAVEAPPPKMTPWGIAAAGLGMSLLVLLITLLIPPGKPAPGRPAAPLALRLSFPAFGAALALCLFALTDKLLVALGGPAIAWSVLIPMALIGVGSGRLWVDTLRLTSLWRAPLMALMFGVVWLVGMEVGGSRAIDVLAGSGALPLTLVFPMLLVSGALLGAPLSWGLRLVGSVQPAAITACWSTHHAGWALGGAAAALGVFYLGIGRILPLGIMVYALGAMLFVVGGRKAFVAR